METMEIKKEIEAAIERSAAMEMAQWRDKQVAVNNRKFEKLRKNLENEIRKGNI